MEIYFSQSWIPRGLRYTVKLIRLLVRALPNLHMATFLLNLQKVKKEKTLVPLPIFKREPGLLALKISL
jgi:hypothetical protein